MGRDAPLFGSVDKQNTFHDFPYAKLEEIYFLMCLSQGIFVCWFLFPRPPYVKEEMKDWFSCV